MSNTPNGSEPARQDDVEDDAPAPDVPGSDVAPEPASGPSESESPAVPEAPDDVEVPEAVAPEEPETTEPPEAHEPPVAARPADAPVEKDHDVPESSEPQAEPAAPPAEPADLQADDATHADAKAAELDAAVQRTTALPLPPDEPAPVVATDPVEEPLTSRRETYVPPEVGATAVGAAALAPEPVFAPAPIPPAQPQTVYVQAPVPPKAKGNRGFGVLVALIGTVVFALLYAGAAYLLLLTQMNAADAASNLVEFVLGRAVFWVPVVAFFIGFALLAAIVNRNGYWAYAVFSLLVGVLVYFSYIAGSLLTVQAWTLTFEQAQSFIADRWTDPFAIVAGVIAQQVPIWFGGWIAARGRQVTKRNLEAVEAYDRELAAGPRPYTV
ncbi:hypothetical protein ACDF64_01395 [Agromyces sp. MMS24-JH15]|uniref:hypothetical protein n=1 Tax=Agromyces sp. MMS24-JH15 TaxID=3243765 RepID=UPI003749597F